MMRSASKPTYPPLHRGRGSHSHPARRPHRARLRHHRRRRHHRRLRHHLRARRRARLLRSHRCLCRDHGLTGTPNRDRDSNHRGDPVRGRCLRRANGRRRASCLSRHRGSGRRHRWAHHPARCRPVLRDTREGRLHRPEVSLGSRARWHHRRGCSSRKARCHPGANRTRRTACHRRGWPRDQGWPRHQGWPRRCATGLAWQPSLPLAWRHP